MGYHGFAYYYDHMMTDVDYTWWVQHIEKHVEKGCHVLDVGCGTGTLSLALTQVGYAVTGVDLSEDMLVVASEKAREQHITMTFLHRDMRELEGLKGYDCVLIAVDAFNYLETEADVKQTLASVHSTLTNEGFFIFDVHTPYKMTETFKDYLYVENDDDLTYIWQVEAGCDPLSVVHELTLFAKQTDGCYRRTVEYHAQRTFERSQYEAWLTEAGFAVLTVEGDQDRQLFVTRKVGS